MASLSTTIRGRLSNAGGLTFSVYAIAAAFGTYFCMYAFRKPFSVATFEGMAAVPLPFLPDLDYKITLIIAQVIGYMLSKFYGVKFISEISASKRALSIILFIGIAELALFFFALTPAPYNILFLFVNGIPLGLIWGLVFGFLEGRRFTEALGAGLSASYIVASGAVKNVGAVLMNAGVSEFWMPFAVGLIFFPLLLLFVYMLQLLPPPTAEDERLRTRREPMYAEDRRRFLTMFGPGLFALTFLYMFLTAYRDFRDNFAAEIWKALGYGDTPGIFTLSELPVTVGVLILLGLLFRIRSNRTALMVIMFAMLGGSALIGGATFLYQAGLLDPAVWMILVGLGLYIGYVPYGCILFERLIAAVGFVGTAGFMIYVTDAFGYLGSVALLLYKNFGHPDLAWLDFFILASYATSLVCCIAFAYSLYYFMAAVKHEEAEESEEVPA